MKDIRTLVILATAVLVTACTQEKNNIDNYPLEPVLEEMMLTEQGQIVPRSAIEQGHIRVYLTDEFSRIARQSILEDGSLPIMEVKSPGLEIISMLGVKRMERTFPFAGEFEPRTVAAGLDKWYDIWFDESYPVEDAIRSLSHTQAFEIAECRPKVMRCYDTAVEVLPVPYPSATLVTKSSDSPIFNDPMLAKQWHYANDGSVAGTAGCDVNVVPVWQAITTGSPDVIVSVVDGGVDYRHEDLADNMWHNPSNKQNPYGYNFASNTYKITPEDHGTHVAGTIAAVSNNGIGVAGLAGGNAALGLPGVQIMSCQIFEGEKTGSGAAAIKWGADHGAVISQNSWGYTGGTSIPASDRAAIDYFNTFAGLDANGMQVGPMAGGIVIFSAGNDNQDYGFPAKYEGTLAVSSIAPDFYKAYYSNYGDWVDLAAPGGDAKKGGTILSTLPGNQYGNMQGTSMACPHVSGVAALVVSKFGGLGFTRDMLWNRLVNTSKDITYTKYNRNVYVAGLVDALAASATLGTIAPDPVIDFSAESLNANFVKFIVRVPADEDDGTAYGINVYYDTEPITSTVGVPSKSFRFGGAQLGELFSATLSGLGFDTKYYLRCVTYDLSGNISVLSDEVTVVTSKNQPPVITTAELKSFDLRAHETKYIALSYSDPDGHAMSAHLFSDTAADTLVVTELTKSQIELDGRRGEPGTYTSTVVVTDEFDATAEFRYTFTIYSNHAPVLKKNIPDMLFSSMGTPQDLIFADYIYDEDGEVLNIELEDSVPGVVNTAVMNGHLYVTPLKLGSDHIRLTAIDAFGESVTTEFDVAVRNGSDPLSVYPNPVKAKLSVSTANLEETEAKVIVSMQTGKIVYSATASISAFNPLVIDMSTCPPGVYLVKVEAGDQSFTKNIVKI